MGLVIFKVNKVAKLFYYIVIKWNDSSDIEILWLLMCNKTGDTANL
jgi:hypothetical protein